MTERSARQPWDAEWSLDAARVATLAMKVAPELAGRTWTLAGSGWDVDVWRSGDVAFRFPRRSLAVPLVTVEARALPFLAPRLPVPIPLPLWIGEGSSGFPHPYYGHRWLEGSTVDRSAATDVERRRLARPLAAFLRKLHATPIREAAAYGVPVDTFRSKLDSIAERTLPRLSILRGSRWEPRLGELEAAVRDAPKAPRDRDAVVLHGDLYARHVLLNESRSIVGVLDWGDVSIGSRIADFTLPFGLLPTGAIREFFEAYGGAEPEEIAAGRYLALCRYGVSLLAYAVAVRDEGLQAEAARVAASALP